MCGFRLRAIKTKRKKGIVFFTSRNDSASNDGANISCHLVASSVQSDFSVKLVKKEKAEQ